MESPADPEVLRRLATALALGLVVGAERGWQERARAEGRRAVGLRTFGLVGLLGGVAAVLSSATGAGAVLPVAWGGLALFVAVAYAVMAPRTGDFGATTELAVVLTFGLGALAASGRELEAAAAAVVTTALLSAKTLLHAWLARMERRELDASLQLLLLAVVVLPLLPDRGMGPWDAVHPRTLGLLVLLVAGISFVGYLAVRLLGERLGLLLTALCGGLTSSTAVALAFSRLARREAASRRLLAAGIGLAAAAMAPRLALEIAAVHPPLLASVGAPLLALALLPLASAGLLLRRGRGASPDASGLALRNPLQLGSAVVFALVLGALFVLTRGAHAWLGDAGVYLLAVISGLGDVDALSLSLARDVRAGVLEPAVAARGVTLAAVVNTAVKSGLAAAVGGRELAAPVALALGPALLAAAALGLALL